MSILMNSDASCLARGWGRELQDWLDNGAYRHHARLRLLDRLYEEEPFERYLDVGCGSGALLAHFLRRGVSGVGIDLAPVVTAHHAGGPIPAFRASVDDIPFRDNSFDFITCLGLIEHLEDAVASLRELLRVTQPGGRAFITVPRLTGVFPALVPFWFFTGGRHRFGWKNMVGTMYTRAHLERQLVESGWEIERIAAFKGSSVLEWLHVPFSERISDFVEDNPVARGLLSIMLVAVCRKPEETIL